MERIEDLRLDRTQFSVARLTDPDDALEYWLSRPVEERLRALELLRRTFYGYTALARDFKEFLKSLNSNGVEYLLIGGYAVDIYGSYQERPTIWTSGSTSIRKMPARIDRALREFGFTAAALTPDLFLARNNVSAWGCRRFGLRSSPLFPESSSTCLRRKRDDPD